MCPSVATTVKEIVCEGDKVSKERENFLTVPPFWALSRGPACFAPREPKQPLPPPTEYGLQPQWCCVFLANLYVIHSLLQLVTTLLHVNTILFALADSEQQYVTYRS